MFIKIYNKKNPNKDLVEKTIVAIMIFCTLEFESNIATCRADAY